MIAVTFALRIESAEFMGRLTDRVRVDRGAVRAVRGKIGDRTVEVFHTGVGEKVCRQRLEKFLLAHGTAGRIRYGEQDQDFDCLISSGFAGALSNDLQIGDLLLAENFSTVDMGKTCAALSDLPIHVANLLTVHALIDSREERSQLALTSKAVAVDMETEFIARACADRAIPVLSLRVISDTPHELFPAPMDIMFDIEHQQTHMMRLAMHLLAHPSSVPRLVQFARRIGRAQKILADALVEVVHNL
jgi:nucleoside phosphorylase